MLYNERQDLGGANIVHVPRDVAQTTSFVMHVPIQHTSSRAID